MVSSLVLYVVGDRGLSRDVSFARHFPLQDVGEYNETCAHGPVPRTWPMRNMSLSTVPLSTLCSRSSKTYERDRRRTQLTPAPIWGPQLPQSESFLVVQLVTNDEGPALTSPVEGGGRLAEGITTTLRPADVVLRRLDRRTRRRRRARKRVQTSTALQSRIVVVSRFPSKFLNYIGNLQRQQHLTQNCASGGSISISGGNSRLAGADVGRDVTSSQRRAARRLWSCCLETDCHVSKSIPLVLVKTHRQVIKCGQHCQRSVRTGSRGAGWEQTGFRERPSYVARDLGGEI